MKKLYWILIVVALISIFGVTFFLTNLKEDEMAEMSYSKEDIIAEMSYTNYAWVYSYYGKLIYGDGSIYSFSDSHKNKELIGNVSESDLKEMKKYSKAIDDKKIVGSSSACDMGAWCIYVWNDKKKILLKETGDWDRENKNPNAKKLINIIEKYDKK